MLHIWVPFQKLSFAIQITFLKTNYSFKPKAKLLFVKILDLTLNLIESTKLIIFWSTAIQILCCQLRKAIFIRKKNFCIYLIRYLISLHQPFFTKMSFLSIKNQNCQHLLHTISRKGLNWTLWIDRFRTVKL